MKMKIIMKIIMNNNEIMINKMKMNSNNNNMWK